MKRVWLYLGLLSFAGCTETAYVTPVNDAAAKAGPMSITFKIYGMGHGEVSVAMASGEVLTGTYTLNREQNIISETAFGALFILTSARGGAVAGAINGASKAELDSTPEWSPGMADVSSPSGLTAHCLIVNSNVTGHGAGTCHFSTGADYNLTY